jgi:hypothetical protein
MSVEAVGMSRTLSPVSRSLSENSNLLYLPGQITSGVRQRLQNQCVVTYNSQLRKDKWLAYSYA